MPTKPMSEQEALLKLSALCSRSEHSSGEMRDKLRRWGFSENEREHIVQRLIDERFVDDERFCRFFVRDKIRFDKWGRRKIEQALFLKGIDSSISQTVLDEICDDDFVEILRPLIAAKRRTTKASSDYELRAKLTRYALSRGFGMNIIKQVVGETYDDETSDFHDDDDF